MIYNGTIKNLAQELIERGTSGGRNKQSLEDFIYDFLEEKESMELLLDPFFYKFLLNEIDIALNDPEEV